MALQLGNAYGLLCLVGLAVLLTTSELKVVRAYLIALLIADVGHVGVTAYGLGYDKFVDFAGWNATTWGNVGVTVGTFPIARADALWPPADLADFEKAFLGFTRTLYLLGLFGPDAVETSAARKTK